MLLVCGGICAAVDQAAHSQRVFKWLEDRALADSRKQGQPFVRTGNFRDYFDTLMLDELPGADYSRGGVYFFGSSNVLYCADFADLPPDQVRLIHNYAFPGADPGEILQFIRYLVERRGFLAAGAEKTCAVVCLGQDDMVQSTPEEQGAGGFFPAYLKSSSFYQYDPVDGIRDAPLTSWNYFAKLRRARWRGLMQRLGRSLEGAPRRQIDMKALREQAERAKTSASYKPLELAELERLMVYLKSRNVDVRFLFMPMGSWNDGTPVHEAFISKTSAICAAKGIPVIDLGQLLSDDQFMDFHHANLEGAQKVKNVLVDVALKYLRLSPDK